MSTSATYTHLRDGSMGRAPRWDGETRIRSLRSPRKTAKPETRDRGRACCGLRARLKRWADHQPVRSGAPSV